MRFLERACVPKGTYSQENPWSRRSSDEVAVRMLGEYLGVLQRASFFLKTFVRHAYN